MVSIAYLILCENRRSRHFLERSSLDHRWFRRLHSCLFASCLSHPLVLCSLSHQTFNDFVTELRRLSENCEFNELRDFLIKDMIICDITDNNFRERMLQCTDIDLNKAINIGPASEQTKLHVKELNNFDKIVDKINRKEYSHKRR